MKNLDNLIDSLEKNKDELEFLEERLGQMSVKESYIPIEVKRKAEDYKDISNFIERELQEFIYIEGIKDSVKLLKALGILV